MRSVKVLVRWTAREKNPDRLPNLSLTTLRPLKTERDP